MCVSHPPWSTILQILLLVFLPFSWIQFAWPCPFSLPSYPQGPGHSSGAKILDLLFFILPPHDLPSPQFCSVLPLIFLEASIAWSSSGLLLHPFLPFLWPEFWRLFFFFSFLFIPPLVRNDLLTLEVPIPTDICLHLDRSFSRTLRAGISWPSKANTRTWHPMFQKESFWLKDGNWRCPLHYKLCNIDKWKQKADGSSKFWLLANLDI